MTQGVRAKTRSNIGPVDSIIVLASKRIVPMTRMMSRFMKDDGGATAIEYGLIAALLAVGLISALGSLKDNLADTFGTVGTALKDAK
jgi:pilus assembly protein Flp/PilA